MEFKKCHFQVSSNGRVSMPKAYFPHVVLAGRSNVGKSSFINHFFQNRQLAKVSSKPGKTGLLNFFNVDDKLFFVDTPGYGYAQRSKATRDSWREMMADYLDANLEKITFLHFIDGRHPPTHDDWDFIHWVKEEGKNLLFIITKIDKVENKDKKNVIQQLTKDLTPYGELVVYNIEEKSIRQEVKEKLGKVLADGQS